MRAQDYLIKAVDARKEVRIIMALTTGMVEEARTRHGTSATATAALGRSLTAAAIMASDLKSEHDALTIRINGQGEIGTILVSANARGQVRGLVGNPLADCPSRYPGKLDVGRIVGKDGYLEVSKDLGLKQEFAGKVALVSGEIAEDLVHYFYLSEQIPSLITLGVLVNADYTVQAAGGVFVQAMPQADDTVLEAIEKRLMDLGSISAQINRSPDLETILASLMQDLDYTVVERQEISFSCNCSRKRLAQIMGGFSSNEIEDIYKTEGKIEVNCNYCNTMYQFTPEEIEEAKSLSRD